MFPLVKPAVTPSKNNTTCSRSQNLQTPAAALLLYLSQTCSGFGLPACRCSLVQSGFPQPFLEITHWLLGEILRSWRDVTVATILLLLSQLLQHIKLLSPNKMTSFAVELKGTPLLKGFQWNGLCFKVFLLRSLWTRLPRWLFSDASPSYYLNLANPMQMQGVAKRDYCKRSDLVSN